MEREKKKKEDIFYDYWMSTLYHIKKDRRIRAVRAAGGSRRLYCMHADEIRSLQILDERDIYWLCTSRSDPEIEKNWIEMAREDIHFCSIFQEEYPQRLRFIPDPPFALFIKGRMPEPSRKSVGIIGARMCSDYGRKIAGLLGEKIAAAGMLVISGMARGVDSAAQAGTLRENGETVAVLGSGCDVCYPKSSRQIYENIINGHGAVISEFLPGTQPVPMNFPIRNRIISGLSDVLVVVEAREKSGSLITVDAALEQGKDVYAVPGRYDDLLSRGCNRLISQGAGILYDVSVFLKEIGADGKEETTQKELLLENENRLVYSDLCLHAKDLMTIQVETGLPLLQVIRILDELKDMGLVEETDRNYFSKTI